MKKVAGTLKLDQAQYRELEAFAKFGSDLDAATTSIIEKGRRNVEILKQGLNQPMLVENQIAIIYCGTKGLLNDIPLDKVKEFEMEFLNYMRKENENILNLIKDGALTEEVVESLEKTCNQIKKNYIS